MKFKVGDEVIAFGMSGYVLRVADIGHYPVEVSFYNNPNVMSFTSDGKSHDWHVEPSLRLVKSEKKKIKKTLYVAVTNQVSQYSSRYAHEVSYAYAEREHAHNQFGKPHQVVPIEIEIEE